MRSNPTQHIVRDFIVDFLGSLVPGIAFLIALIPAILVPIYNTVCDVFGKPPFYLPGLSGQPPVPVGTVLFLVVPAILGFLTFAYIIGHVFYRQDPKYADEASFRRIPRQAHHNGMCRPLKDGSIPIEFPYHFLKQYLLDRHIEYLASRIPWDETDYSRRAKHYANALKIRIQLESPESYFIISRNEAHVRLSSSMWFVSRLLMWLSVIGVVLTAVTMIFTRNFGTCFIFPFIAAAFSGMLMVSIERALHYQREREVLFILETAHWLAKTGKASTIFQGIEP